MNPVWYFLNGIPARVVVSSGAVSAPSIAIGATGSGFYSPGANEVAATINGAALFDLFAANIRMTSTTILGWASGDGTTTATDTSMSRASANVITTPGRFVSTGATSGIGYATGAGGAVTQLTSKATGVTLNTVTGQITMHNAALAAAAEVSFVVTNSAVAATDVVIVNHASAGTAGAYLVGIAAVGAGSFTVTVANLSAGSLSEAIVLNFVVIKGVAA